MTVPVPDLFAVPARVLVWLVAHALNSLPSDTWEGPLGDDPDTDAVCDAFCCPYCCGPCAALLELSCTNLDTAVFGAAVTNVYGPGDSYLWRNSDGSVNWEWVHSKWVTVDGVYPMQKVFNCHRILEDGTHVHHEHDDDEPA